MVNDIRLKRIEKEMKKITADIVEKMKDPHFSSVTITEVNVRNDLRLATIKYITHDRKRLDKYFKNAKGYIKKKISEKIGLRYMPDIEFQYDRGIDYQDEMSKIFEEIKNEENNK